MHRRPSPALVVAVLALIAALAGTAIASGPEANSAKLTKKKVKRIADKEIRKHVPLEITDTETVRPRSGGEDSIVLVQHRDYTVRGVCSSTFPVPGLRAAIEIRGPEDSYYKAIATDAAGKVVSVSNPLTPSFSPITQAKTGTAPSTVDATGWAWTAFDMIGFNVFGAINAPRPDRGYCIFGGTALHNKS